MSELERDIKELREEFQGIDRAIVDGAKNMRTMQATLSRTNAILGSKNWEIFSRFISGTGLWRVQNRVKATVQLLNEMANSTERRRLEEVKQLKVYAEIADTAKEIQDIQDNIEVAEKATGQAKEDAVQALREQSKIFGGLLFQHQDQNKALKEMSRLMDKQVKDIEKLENAATKGAKRRREGLIANSLTVKSAVAISNKMKEASKFAQGFVGQQYTKVTDAAAALSETTFGVGEKELDKRFEEAGLSRDMEIVTDKSGKERIKGGGRKGFSSEEDIAQLRALKKLETNSNKLGKPQLRFLGKTGKFVFTPLTNIAKFAGRIAKGILSVVRTMFMAAGYLLIIMLGLTLLRKVFTENKEAFIAGFEKMKEVFSIGMAIVASGLGDAKDALQRIWAGFQEGKIMEVVYGVGELLLAGLTVLGGLIVATFGAVIMGAVEFIRNVFNTKLDEIRDDFDSIRGAMVAAGLHVVKVLAMIVAGIALVGVLIFGLPALVIAGIAGLIYILADKLIPYGDEIASVLFGIKDFLAGIPEYIMGLPAKIAEFIGDKFKEAMDVGSKVKDRAKGALSSAKNFIGLAEGGKISQSGLAVVGERGPELVQLPRGAQVHSNSASKAIASSVTNNITVQVTGRVGANDAEIRDIANKVAREINSRMNRTTTSVVKF